MIPASNIQRSQTAVMLIDRRRIQHRHRRIRKDARHLRHNIGMPPDSLSDRPSFRPHAKRTRRAPNTSIANTAGAYRRENLFAASIMCAHKVNQRGLPYEFRPRDSRTGHTQ